MANIVSFIFKGIDRYSAIAKNISRATSQVREQFKGASLGASFFKNKVDMLNSSIRKGRMAMSEFSNNVKNVSNRLEKHGKRIADVGTRFIVGATLPAVFLGKHLLQAASDAAETENKFKVVFSGVSKEANQVAKDLAKGYGLSRTASKQLLSDTGDLLTGFGFTQKSALDLSKQVNTLAVDLASFTNYSGGTEGASQALTKALLGERESVKLLGISILEEDVKRKVQILRMKGARFETMRQAKAVATLALAQEQSKNAIGDFARSSKEFANQQRILSGDINNLSVDLGSIFLPVATKAIGILIKLVRGFQGWSKESKKIVLIGAMVAATIGPLLLILGGIALILPTIISGFTVLGSILAVAFSPVTLIIFGLIAAIYLLKKNWIEISDIIGGTIEQIQINFDVFVKSIKSKIESIRTTLMALFSSVDNPLFKAIGDFFSIGPGISSESSSTTTIDVNLNAPKGTVQGIKTNTTGNIKNLSTGLNLVTTPG